MSVSEHSFGVVINECKNIGFSLPNRIGINKHFVVYKHTWGSLIVVRVLLIIAFISSVYQRNGKAFNSYTGKCLLPCTMISKVVFLFEICFEIISSLENQSKRPHG